MTDCKTFMDICDICVVISYITVNIQKFQTLVACQKGINTRGFISFFGIQVSR